MPTRASRSQDPTPEKDHNHRDRYARALLRKHHTSQQPGGRRPGQNSLASPLALTYRVLDEARTFFEDRGTFGLVGTAMIKAGGASLDLVIPRQRAHRDTCGHVHLEVPREVKMDLALAEGADESKWPAATPTPGTPSTRPLTTPTRSSPSRAASRSWCRSWAGPVSRTRRVRDLPGRSRLASGLCGR
jgi:hypothetical protein